jgi:hypothetical protein
LNGETRLLASLVPTRGYFPDFLTPPEGVLGVEPAIEAVRETPPHLLRRDLSQHGHPRPRSGWVDALADGDARALDRLISALCSYHRAAVAPYWPHIRARIEADRAARGRALLDGGADQLLSLLPRMVRWRPPVLEADYPVDRDLYPEGRGLLLLPSFFCRRTPVTYHDQDLTPVLVYPVQQGAEPVAGVRSQAKEAGDCGGASLGKLVGHTRSAVLHTLTPLGAALLRGGAAAPAVAGTGR